MKSRGGRRRAPGSTLEKRAVELWGRWVPRVEGLAIGQTWPHSARSESVEMRVGPTGEQKTHPK